MKRFFWIINLTLLAVAAAITLTAFYYAPPPTSGRLAMRAAPPSSERGAGLHAASMAGELAGENRASIESIWQRSLFRPERRDAEAAAEQQADGGMELPCNLELLGVGVLGNSAAAIICAGEQQPAAAARVDAFSGRDVDPRPKGKGAAKRHVYKVGQAVGDSGFTVKTVSFDSVILARGTQEQTLTLKKTNSGRAKGSIGGKAVNGTTVPNTKQPMALRPSASLPEAERKAYQPVNTAIPVSGNNMPTSDRIRLLRGAGGAIAAPLNNVTNSNQRPSAEKMKILSAPQS